MTELAFSSAIELADKIRTKQISSVELTKLYIDRIELFDGAINAVVVRIFDEALASAEIADAMQARGESLGPLHGVPMTIKESYVIKGTPATWGLESFSNNIAQRDGLAVARFKAAGAHFLGKTNVPVNLADFQSYNPVYGTTGNPWDTERTPGGSSGGSAAALAAGFSGLEAGSDIGGSIRNPAHFCGVYGHKPTYGVIPMQGHELMNGIPDADLAVCGPLARSAEDLHLALDIMAGPADREGLGWQLSLPSADFKQLKDLRVAIWANDEAAPVAREVAERADEVGRILSDMGALVSDSARPNFDGSSYILNYRTLLNSVMSASLPPDQVSRIQEHVDSLDPKDFSEDAVLARSAVLSHRDWIRANVQREKLRHAWDLFFEDWDILICPQMATTAFLHDQGDFEGRVINVDNQEQPYFTQLFWSGLVTNAYLPSTVFPTGLSSSGLPIGLQAVSAPYRDHRTIEFARQITQQMGGFVAPSAYL
jgi:amidase